MSHLVLCRVCLIGNVTIHSIRNTSLQELYQKLTNYKLTTKDKRPETLCFKCLAQLQRYHRFLVRSQKSKEILTQLSFNGIEILQETVAILNRDIQRDYCITTIETYSNFKNEQENIKIEEEFTTENSLQDENCETADVEAALCRVCLVGDVKTCSVRNTPLQVVYEKLINSKLSTTAGRDDIVCFLCHWQLRKCRKFIIKSKKSENILSELIRNGIQLSQNTVTLLNRQIKSNLETAPVESTSYYTPDISAEHQPEYTDIDNTVCEEQNHFECNECGYACERKSVMIYHLQRHDPNRRYECDNCKNRFLCMSHLKAHKQNVHLYKYSCKECEATFVKQHLFRVHMLMHAGKDSTTCGKCKKTFESLISLRRHEKKHLKYPCVRCNASFASVRRLSDHVFKLHTIHFPFYICDICGGKYKQKSRISKHMRNVHVKIGTHKCDICKKILGSKVSLNVHILGHTNLKPFKCTLCPRTFRLSAQCKMHMKIHTGVKPYVCEICNKSFPYKNSLKMHYTTHNKWTCDICGQQYSRKRYLAEHIMNHMTGLNNTYSCDKCSKAYPLKEQLNIHMYSHRYTPKKVPYETCKVCNKQSKNLKVHMRLHTGEKPYSCKICEKSYTSSGALYIHVQTHVKEVSKDRPHICTTCGKCFKRKSHLVIHMSTHSEVKPYACELCDRSYHNTRTLNHHMRNHKEKIMFACDQCDRTFSDKRSLNGHITISHPSEKAHCYVCDMCFKVHIDRKAFIVHLKTHKKTKPYRCDSEKCKKSFSKIIKLAKHFKEHIRDKQYDCTLCRKMILRSSLMRHYRTKHGGMKPYACNCCDEDFVHFHLVHAHYRRFHSTVNTQCL